MAKKPRATLIQAPNGAVRRVRLDNQEFEVVSAMPTIVNGQVGVTMTIVNVEIDAAVEEEKATNRTA